MSRIYVNRSDRTSDYMTKVKPIEGFKDFGAHGTPDELIYEGTSGEETTLTVKEFAQTLRDDPLFGGGNIRLLACHTGAQKNVFAQ